MAGLFDFLNYGQENGGGLLGSLGTGQFNLTPQEKRQQDMLLAGLGAGGANYDGSSPRGGAPVATSPFDNAQPWSPQAMPRSIMDLLPQQPQQAAPAQAPQPSAWDNPQQYQAPQQASQSPAPPTMNSFAGLQVPTFGSPPTNELSAQSAQPQYAQAQAQPSPAAQPQIPAILGGSNPNAGIGDRLSAGLSGFANSNGILPAISNLVTGLSTGQRTDPRGMRQETLQAQFLATTQALMANGMPEAQAKSTAMLSVFNPEAAKTILPEALSNKEKYQVISEDPLSGKQYGFVNDRAQTVNGKPLGQGGAQEGQSSGLQGMTDRITAMRTQGATKEQMLAQIPTGYRDDVASLIDGKSVPANLGRSQLRGPLLTLAKVIDPTFDETLIPARVQMRKDFAGEGKNGQAIGAFNTVQHHAGQLSDAIDEYQKAGGGSNWPLINKIKLTLANNTSIDPKLRDAAQKVKDKLNAVEHEVAGAYNAGHITDADRKSWNDIVAENLPADQLRQKLANFDELLSGKRDSLNHTYQIMFHTDAPTIDRKANEEASAKIHSRLPGYSRGGDPSSPAAVGLPDRSAVESEMRRRGLLK